MMGAMLDVVLEDHRRTKHHFQCAVAALGLADDAFQSLYHFTVGRPVEDRRPTTLPAYPD